MIKQFQCLCVAGLITLVATPGLAEQRHIELAIEHGRLVGADKTIRLIEGDEIRVTWTSDQRADIHIHGYDLELTVPAGKSVEMQFDAYATGRFPITLHRAGGSHGHGALGYFEVLPR